MAKFPPLPAHPDCHVMRWTESELRAIRARDLEIWRMAMQEAAKSCEFNAQRWLHSKGGYAAHECAAAIRALPEPVHE